MASRYLDPQPGIRVFAHRGLALGVPENTLSAFSAAVAAGADYVETDVHVTRDGVPVLHHDAVIVSEESRIVIADETWDALKQHDLGDGEHLATLDDALTAFPDVRFNIDVKAGAAAAPAAGAILSANAVDRVLVTSFNESTRRDAVELLPGVATSASSDLIIAALPWLYLGHPRRAAAVFSGVPAVQVPERKRGFRLVSPRMVRLFHAAGVEVHVWTVNEPGDMLRLRDWGVDGIVTDRCDIARGVLGHRKNASD